MLQQTWAHLRLGLDPILAPHVDPVAPHHDGAGLGVLQNGLAQALRELALARRVLDDGDGQVVVVPVALQPLLAPHIPSLRAIAGGHQLVYVAAPQA